MGKIKNFLNTNLAFLIVLTVVVFAIYGKSINYELTKYDDSVLITKTINFIAETANIPKLFTTSCYYSNNYTYYRPILTLSFAIEAIMFGNNTKVYHLSNIILFIISIYLMYVFLSRLKQNPIILKFICLLIAVHPMFSSCIAWIPARNDTLLIIFSCLSFLNLFNYLKNNSNISLFLFSIYFGLALFTKETSLILIPMYVFFIYVFKFKITKKQILKTITILFSILIFYFYLRSISVHHININIVEWYKYAPKILTSVMIYIYNFLIPAYIPVMIYKLNTILPILIINISFLLFLFFCIYKKIIDISTILSGFVWLILWLFPTFLIPDYILLFHRFLLPVIGLILILCKITNNIILEYPVSKKYLIIIFLILFGSYSYASYIQSDKYKNSFIFWAHAYSDAPDYHIACHGLGLRFMEINNYEKALDLMFAAENYSPNRYLLDIAAVFLYQQRFDEAEKILLKSVELSPGTSDLAYGNLAKLYAYKKDFKKAMEYVNKTYELNKYDIEFTKLLITIYTMNGEFKKALDMCFSLLQYDKKNAQYYYKIGELYELMKDYKNALKYVDEGLKLAPENIQLIEKAEFLKNMQKNYV